MSSVDILAAANAKADEMASLLDHLDVSSQRLARSLIVSAYVAGMADGTAAALKAQQRGSEVAA